MSTSSRKRRSKGQPISYNDDETGNQEEEEEKDTESISRKKQKKHNADPSEEVFSEIEAEKTDNEEEEEYEEENDNGTKSDRNSHRKSIHSPLISINPAGKPAEAGVIHRVHVENFMCHRKLTINLCRNVNFIHGQNGSGKSAILAAIQICLGAGAKRTHRARNLKELVRKESVNSCNGALVRVTLLNRGEDAFQHNLYGDTITVERCISLGGGYNGYRLRDHNLRERSRSKKDLDAMLDQLNIQVENPVAVLDQEEAKKFLCGKAEDKYNFFTKATELERIDRSYATVVDNIQELDEAKARVEHNLKPAVENVKKLLAEKREFEQMEKLELKISDLRVLSSWSIYWECFEKVKIEEKNLKEIELKLTKRKQELEKSESLANVDDEKEVSLKQKLEELTNEAEQAAKRKSSLEDEYKAAMLPVKKLERGLGNLKREIASAKRRFKAATKLLQETRDEIMRKAGSAQSEEAKRTARMNQAEKDMAKAREDSDLQKEEISQSLKKYEELEPAEKNTAAAVVSANRQLQGISKKLKDLKSSEENSLAVFGGKCVLMHQKVEQAVKQRKFRGPVIGPIGMYLKVAPGKEHLASIAELALGGGVLDRFVVTHDADRSLFMKLRQHAGCQPRDCGVFQMHQGPRYQIRPPPSSDVETVASVLNVTNDLVFNCLVDNCRTDQVSLMPSKESSEEKLLIEQNGKYAIRGGNINRVYFLPNGDYWQVTPKTGSLSMTSTDRRLKRTIGVDRTEAIKEAENEANQISNELNDLRAKEADAKRNRQQYQVKWNKANRALEKTKGIINSLENTIEEIRTEAAEAAENDAIDTTDLEDDVKQADEAHEALKTKEEEDRKSIQELQPAIEGIKNLLEETTARNEKVLNDINTSEKILEDYMRCQAERSQNVEKKRKKVKQAEDTFSRQQEVVGTRIEKKDEALEKARLVTYNNNKAKADKGRKSKARETGEEASLEQEDECGSHEAFMAKIESIEPIETDRDPAFYKGKLQRAERDLEKERKRRQLSEKDPEVAFQKYQRAKKDLDLKVYQIQKIQKNVDKLVKDVKGRKRRWREFREHIGVMTNNTFDEMLNKKGSSGLIEFDHTDKQLNLIVQKDNRNENSQTKDVKALSGGERSFTTLSLLLALGEHLETPFRVMDEFDVFLDPVSRKLALEAMIAVAKDMEHRQFIFITPQDLSNLKTDPMLKIFQMKPPERSTLIGGPSQQTLPY